MRGRRYRLKDDPVPKRLQCIHNAFVECPEKNNCKKCGWNPEVSRARIEKMGYESDINIEESEEKETIWRAYQW